jgi:TolB-like protein
VVALAIIAIAIWQLLPQRKVAPPPPSDSPSIAIMYFKNNTGDESLDNWRTALSDLITSDLAQSKYIYVLSEDRLFNILKELDLLEARNYSTDDLNRVASRGNVENILLGSYSKAGDDFRINTSIRKISSGEDSRLDAVEGKGEESYFSMVDELTRRIKENFMLSKEQIATDIDKKAEQITTSSPEAYKYYVEGSKYIKKGENRKAIQFLQKAVEIDPEFAMAYRTMAVVYGNMGYNSESIDINNWPQIIQRGYQKESDIISLLAEQKKKGLRYTKNYWRFTQKMR